MMRNRSQIVFLIFVLALFNLGCKKNPFDFRTKYTGDYNFVYTYSSWIMGQPNYDSGTIHYAGKVDYEEKGMINIHYNTNSTLQLEIDKDGNLSLPCGTTIGKFENKNKVYINYTSHSCPASGGMGGGSSYSITGTK